MIGSAENPANHVPEQDTAGWIVHPSWNGPAFGEKNASKAGSDGVQTTLNESVETNAVDTRNVGR
jgi:hypothetical protein